ncbi:Mur ligase family protein [Modestobacter muralis]|uniref:Mur ligase family protein n=1 Tax=Modestobacter muralis TaxID=1608614 RepID=UPI0030B8C79A
MRAQLGPLGAVLAGDPADRLRLVGVTGSNGKTTTSTLVRGVLQAAGECAGVLTTLGARVGDQTPSTRLTTPEAPELHGLLAWMLDAGATSAVVEAPSIALDVGRVDGVHVSVAVFTGFEEDHLDNHGTIEQYWASKARLLTPERTDSAVIVVDDPTADVRVVSWQIGAAGTNLVVEDADGRHWLSSPLVGRVHMGNLAAAWATGRAMGVPPQTVAAGLATTAPPAGRNTLLRADAGPLVVVDYAHTPRALAAALQTAHELTGPGGRVHLVLGGPRPAARGRRDRYKRQGRGVSARAADTVWLTDEGSHGERPESIVEELRVGLLGGTAEVHTVLDRRAAITAAVQAGGDADVVIVVGRGHETTMTDDGAPVDFHDTTVARQALAARSARTPQANVVAGLNEVAAVELLADRAS